MEILVGCEESQVLCKAFRDAGHSAYSCDLEPTRGNPDWHYQQDIMGVIPRKQWDLIMQWRLAVIGGTERICRGMMKGLGR